MHSCNTGDSTARRNRLQFARLFARHLQVDSVHLSPWRFIRRTAEAFHVIAYEE